MARWKYKSNIIDLTAVLPPEFIECDEKGYCEVIGLPGGLDRFKGILDKEGESEWELVQCHTYSNKLLCIWKKEVKEAFVS
ncbi:MAG: hypothetical protein JRC90_05845 [Deltaproteobacteria bacterium]|nr:hypothetical protein [Deltaproteobacteria bacterium]